MIPRTIHFIFFGFTEFHYIHYLAVKSAVAVHGVPVKLYYSQAPKDNPLWDEIASMVELVQVDPPQEFRGHQLTSYQYKADILRLQILIEQGGAYLDIDVISLRPFDEFWNEHCVLGIESADGSSITNAVMMAEPNHPFMQRWLDDTATNLENKPWAWHGVCLPREIYDSQAWPDIRLEPRASFMPFDFRDRYIFTQEEGREHDLDHSYTMHMWDTIWGAHLAHIDSNYIEREHNYLTQICKPYVRKIPMPTSSDSGKTWIQQQLKRIADRLPVRTVLDIGAGAGTYHNRYNGLFNQAEWTAIEVWQPYLDKYELTAKYDRVVKCDARKFEWDQQYDLVFAGDVLEHMTKMEAHALVDTALRYSPCVVVSIPIIHMPQGEHEGNPFERHIKDDWTDAEFQETFGDWIVDHSVDNEIGVYVLSRDSKWIQDFRRLRIAIYTICKNEEKNVNDWAASNAEADYRLVCDTGSSDQTREQLLKHGINMVQIAVMPWRFDIARETSLNLLPPDIDVCIWQDLDERLLPGWRQEIEKHWEPGTTTANHRYRNNGRPWQWHSKIHARHGCTWTGAVHETLRWEVPEHTIWISEFYLDEHQDMTKSRRSYIDLLECKIREGDRAWRTYSFYSNELSAQNRIGECIDQRKKAYEACDEGPVVKSYVARTIAQAYASIGDHTAAERWFQTAVTDSPERESWFYWAQHCHGQKNWQLAYLYAMRTLAITQRRDGFTYDPAAWGAIPHDIAALSAYYLGMHQQAVEQGRLALSFAPDDQRLQRNQDFYEESITVPLPDTLTIETASNCNRTCGTCIRNTDPDRERVAPWFKDNLMSMDMIRKIFDDARSMGFRKDLCLSFYNEPTMDTRLADIVDLAVQYPFRNIFMHSNGDLVTEELAERIDGKITWIYFSIYADQPAKERREQQIKSWFKKTDTRFSRAQHGLTHFGPVPHMDSIIAEVIDKTCSEPLDRLIINHRGEMTMCCDDMGGNFDLGNVNDSCLYDLWFGDKHQRMLKQLQRRGGRKGLKLCETCPRPHQQDFTVKNIIL